MHPNKESLVTQREIGPHASGFTPALKAAIREDPDCILVGEMRDLETIELALNAAETGLLVFGTLHTNSAAKTMDRVINVFPTERQDNVRGILAGVIKCVLSQQLLRRNGGGRVAAVEILFASGAISSLIREGKTHQISGAIQTGVAQGMIGMDASLKNLVREGVISSHAALEKALEKDDMRRWLRENSSDDWEDEESLRMPAVGG